MKIFLAAIGAMCIVSFSPARAGEDGATKGEVVIGIKGSFADDFSWRPFDPSTGRLLPFKVARNIASESKKQLSGLFSGLGRLGRKDKRYDGNKAGVSYRLASLEPGVYVLETITGARRWSVFQGKVPIVRIVAGQAAYVGDYSIERNSGKGVRASASGYSATDARAFLSMFPKVTSQLVNEQTGNAVFDCHGKLVAFSSQLVCDSDQSRVSEVNFDTSVGKLAPLPPDIGKQ